uniref:Uncharacterized protein n=1 Tax=Arundo donax TaxID=35708 RepID=A0A0A8YJF9_ARUDO
MDNPPLKTLVLFLLSRLLREKLCVFMLLA